MSSGKLGVLVIMIALIGAIIGSWAMSMDVNENEVTKYDPLADMTGEFQSEAVPEYTKFNPSTNYTGYYTDESVFNSIRYFDGVEFESSNPNNYRLNLKPLVSTTEGLDLTDATTHPTHYVAYWQTAGSTSPITVKGATISQFVSDQGWTDMDEILIISDFENYQLGGFFSFFAKSELKELPLGINNGKVALLKNPTVTGTVTYSTSTPGPDQQPRTRDFDSSKISNPILACKYTLTNNQVQLFYDREMKQPAGIYAPDDALILWGPGIFGTDGTYTILDLQNPAYMDPSKGVELI